MKISLNWLRQLITLPESAREIGDKLTHCGLEVEGIEEIESIEGEIESDHIFEIGLTPNRADAASHLGVARDLKVLFDRPITMPSIDSFKVDNTQLSIRVTVENTEACLRYSALTISGVTIQPSPDWLQTRLKSIGISPSNNVVDATNYVLHHLGQPLHAFDASAITGEHIIVKTLPEGSKFVALDTKERTLSVTDLMICNEKEPMCIAGVFGGLKSGVTEKTTDIFLESACFSPDHVRKTAQRHQLKTDAAFRYERGTDPNITVYALKYAALLIQEVAGGKVSAEVTDIYPRAIKGFEIPAKYESINRLIGRELDKQQIKDILSGLEIQLTRQTDEGFTAIVPAYRVDVQREADLVEEILRIYGYNNIKLKDTLNSSFLSTFDSRDADAIQLELSRLLAGAGYHEVLTNSLTKPGYVENSGLNVEESVHILNYLSEELSVMRQSLLFSGLEVIDRNIKRKQTNLRLFEFGSTYHKMADGYKQKERLAIFLTGDKLAETWLESKRAVQYHDLFETVAQILNKFAVTQCETSTVQSSLFAYGITITIRGKTLASLGKVAPAMAKLGDVKQEVFMADIDWALLKPMYPLTIDFQPISKFPEVKRDLSLVVDKAVSFEDIKKLTDKLEQQLITRINVFDVYEGEKIDKNQKAYAISFFLQDHEKTLTDQVIDKTMNRLIKGFEKEFEAIIRR